MKITILGTAYPYRGGLAAFNERLARQFIAEGNEVEIITFTLQYPDFLFPGKTQYSDSPQPSDLKIKRMMNSVEPISWIKTGKYIKKQSPDLLVIKFWIPLMAPCLATIARIAKKNKHTRVVSVLDNVIPHEHRPFDKVLINYFMNSVDSFVAMSDSVLNDGKQVLKHRKDSCFTLCPHPLYDHFGKRQPQALAKEKLGIKKDNIVLLFFGFIRDYKGLDLLLQAYADSRIDKDSVTLLVAGEFYNNQQKYKDLERELGLEGKIDWHADFIADEEVATYFSAADLVVQPYKTATQSGVTQIGYHFEKPMLVTDVGGLAEIIPNGKVGYVVEPKTEKIADALVDFISNSRADEFEKNIKIEKQKYAWSRMTQAITK